MKEIKVLIVEDRDVIRDSIRLSLLRSKTIKIIGEASDGYEAIEMVKRQKNLTKIGTLEGYRLYDR